MSQQNEGVFNINNVTRPVRSITCLNIEEYEKCTMIPMPKGREYTSLGDSYFDGVDVNSWMIPQIVASAPQEQFVVPLLHSVNLFDEVQGNIREYNKAIMNKEKEKRHEMKENLGQSISPSTTLPSEKSWGSFSVSSFVGKGFRNKSDNTTSSRPHPTDIAHNSCPEEGVLSKHIQKLRTPARTPNTNSRCRSLGVLGMWTPDETASDDGRPSRPYPSRLSSWVERSVYLMDNMLFEFSVKHPDTILSFCNLSGAFVDRVAFPVTVTTGRSPPPSPKRVLTGASSANEIFSMDEDLVDLDDNQDNQETKDSSTSMDDDSSLQPPFSPRNGQSQSVPIHKSSCGDKGSDKGSPSDGSRTGSRSGSRRSSGTQKAKDSQLVEGLRLTVKMDTREEGPTKTFCITTRQNLSCNDSPTERERLSLIHI